MKSNLKKVTIYLTAEEYQSIEKIASDEAVTISAVLRAQLGLSYRRAGAPLANRNRRIGQKIADQQSINESGLSDE
jgi:hypothetical protein